MSEHEDRDELTYSGADFRALHDLKRAEGMVTKLHGKDHNLTAFELDGRVYVAESDYVRINQRGNDEDVVLKWRPDLKPTPKN
jgi:hypothetical protein